ncbi:MAG: PilW family protein [Minisyncoccota bacterium]
MHVNFRQSRKLTNRGFTLVELIVSMGIFSIVVLIATSSVLSMVDANRKAQAMRITMDGVSFALDDISRIARTGYNYQCISSADPSFTMSKPSFLACPNGTVGGAPVIGVKVDTIVGTVEYYFDSTDNTIKKAFYNGGATPGSYPAQTITPPEAKITNAKFYVLGNQAGAPGTPTPDQPRILILVDGQYNYFGKSKLDTTFKLQTLVTSRYPQGKH